jgi:transposase-like protein
MTLKFVEEFKKYDTMKVKQRGSVHDRHFRHFGGLFFTLFLSDQRRFNKAAELPAILSGTGQKSMQQQFDG